MPLPIPITVIALSFLSWNSQSNQNLTADRPSFTSLPNCPQNEFPFLVSIELKRYFNTADLEKARSGGAATEKSSGKCAGSLLSRGQPINDSDPEDLTTYVLTAASCIPESERPFTLPTIRLKNQVLALKSVKSPPFSSVHDHFHPKLLLNDLALFQLDEKLEHESFAQLPTGANAAKDCTVARVPGWGPHGAPSTPPRCATVTLAKGFADCQMPDTFKPFQDQFSNKLVLQTITTRAGEDSCVPDSGSPLVCNGTLIGVASGIYVPGCGSTAGSCVQYTAIANYLDFILDSLESGGPEKKHRKGLKRPFDPRSLDEDDYEDEKNKHGIGGKAEKTEPPMEWVVLRGTRSRHFSSATVSSILLAGIFCTFILQ